MLEKTWTLAEGDEVKNADGVVFTIKKIGKDMVILQSLSGDTQVLTGKRGIMMWYEKVSTE